jgi:hypothetical protein
LTEQQNSDHPAQHVVPQPQDEFPHVQMAPYAVPGLSSSSTPEPTTTALPTMAERLMKLRLDSFDPRNPAALSTRVVLTPQVLG